MHFPSLVVKITNVQSSKTQVETPRQWILLHINFGSSAQSDVAQEEKYYEVPLSPHSNLLRRRCVNFIGIFVVKDIHPLMRIICKNPDNAMKFARECNERLHLGIGLFYVWLSRDILKGSEIRLRWSGD